MTFDLGGANTGSSEEDAEENPRHWDIPKCFPSGSGWRHKSILKRHLGPLSTVPTLEMSFSPCWTQVNEHSSSSLLAKPTCLSSQVENWPSSPNRPEALLRQWNLPQTSTFPMPAALSKPVLHYRKYHSYWWRDGSWCGYWAENQQMMWQQAALQEDLGQSKNKGSQESSLCQQNIAKCPARLPSHFSQKHWLISFKVNGRTQALTPFHLSSLARAQGQKYRKGKPHPIRMQGKQFVSTQSFCLHSTLELFFLHTGSQLFSRTSTDLKLLEVKSYSVWSLRGPFTD